MDAVVRFYIGGGRWFSSCEIAILLNWVFLLLLFLFRFYVVVVQTEVWPWFVLFVGLRSQISVLIIMSLFQFCSFIYLRRWWSSDWLRWRLDADNSFGSNISVINIYWAEINCLPGCKFPWVLSFTFRHMIYLKLQVTILPQWFSCQFKADGFCFRIVKFMIRNSWNYPGYSSNNIITAISVYLNLSVPNHSTNIFILLVLFECLTSDTLL